MYLEALKDPIRLRLPQNYTLLTFMTLGSVVYLHLELLRENNSEEVG